MTQNELSSIWTQALPLIKESVGKLTFETWIKPLSLVYVNQDTIHFFAPNKVTKTYTEQYISLFRNAIAEVASISFPNIEVFEKSEKKLSPLANSKEHFDVLSSSPSTLNPKYTFDNFIVGSSNRYAYSAAMAVSSSPKENDFNPLFLYGGSGLGKTHLLQAIGNHVLEEDSTKKVIYIQSESFTNEFISCIQNKNYTKFREKYRKTDYLLIDDIQFIADKEKMQEEFFHTFNTLKESGKNIILSCDKPPNSLTSLEDRLKTRLAGGFIIDITPPDYETRVAILKNLSKLNNLIIPDNVLEYTARNISLNIRELEGAFKTVLAYCRLLGEPISVEMAREALKDLISPSNNQNLTFDIIIDIVSNYFNISAKELCSKNRSRSIAYPRQVAMYLSKKVLDCTYKEIADAFYRKDHSTVIYAYDKIDSEIKENSESDAAKAIKEMKKRLLF